MSRILLLSAISFAALFFLGTPYGRKKVSAFISSEAHPLNLSVFRIVLFLALFLHGLALNPLWFNQIPHELLITPSGLGWVSSYLPLNQEMLRVIYFAYLFFCVTGLLGFLTRTSAFFVTALGLVVIGVPQMYVKLNHEHHLLWFSMLFIFSRSADVFALDAIKSAYGRADEGITEPPGPSKIYGWPIAFILLLIGIIYFFPGFWKVWVSGSEWVVTGILKNHLYWKWVEYPDWTPFFRLDQSLFLMQFLAFATIAFELSFIFLLFFPNLRPWQGLTGLAFHGGTTWFMHIPFWQLQMCYVIFFDWSRIFERIGSRMFRDVLYVFYDGNCKLCRRTIAAIRVFDIFGRTQYINSLDSKALHAYKPTGVSEEALLKDMHAACGKKVWRGYDSYRALAWQIPVLWPVLPILYFFPIKMLGDWIYRRVADARTCSIPSPVVIKQTENRESVFISVVGCFLILVNSWYGIKDIHSFPFSVYPTFENIVYDGRLSVLIEPRDINGNLIPLDTKEIQKKLTSSRWHFMLAHALKIEDTGKQQVYLKMLWRFAAANIPGLDRAETVTFFKVLNSGNPDKKAQNPLSKELLFEWVDINGILTF